MKEIFVADLHRAEPGAAVELSGWVKARRKHGQIVFLDVGDSTGSIQVVAQRINIPAEHFESIRMVSPESAVRVTGCIHMSQGMREISAHTFEVIGEATLHVSPRPRSEIDIFDPNLQEALLKARYLYLRNDQVMAILKFRHLLMGLVHDWFRKNRFIEITAPILTTTPLYDDGSAMSLDIKGQSAFLTQCVGFYLESAVHAFERVYNIGPSFRGEESRSKRHLMEYWHIKAELAFGNLEDIIDLVERLIRDVTEGCCAEGGDIAKVLKRDICRDGVNIPFPRITYREAITRLKGAGVEFEFGRSLGSEEEAILSKDFDRPFWVVGIPRAIEPFPYVIHPDDPEVTMTADLIASNGCGELLGVAEKIHNYDMLIERMTEKHKYDPSKPPEEQDPRYRWLLELRQYGCVPHIGFGMGVERFIRWLIDIPHVRDTIPFFRTFGRRIDP